MLFHVFYQSTCSVSPNYRQPASAYYEITIHRRYLTNKTNTEIVDALIYVGHLLYIDIPKSTIIEPI
jgi:DNA-dependent RNA polymerase auxiliary subunit epsilon